MDRMDYEQYKKDLAFRESSSDKTKVNSLGYLGLYQMGEYALVTAGAYKKQGNLSTNDWTGTFTGKYGVYSKEDFLNNEEAQDKALFEYTKDNWRQLKNGKAFEYINKTVNGILVTPSGLLGAAHLKGAPDTNKYFREIAEQENCSNNSSISKKHEDGFGTRLEDYLQYFSDYDVSNITKMPHKNYAWINYVKENGINIPREMRPENVLKKDYSDKNIQNSENLEKQRKEFFE